ncbi:MAG: Lrp/AsnC family transcriptional regulator [Nanoarchaeota archaeon]
MELIDEKDRKILEILKENSNLSTHKISKKTLIPVTTVNNHIKKLREQGIIKRYTIEVDRKKLGYTISAYVFVGVSLKELKENNLRINDLVKSIRKSPVVDSAENVTGDIDIIIKVHAKDIDEIKDYVVNNLSELKGVEKTRTGIILEYK